MFCVSDGSCDIQASGEGFNPFGFLDSVHPGGLGPSRVGPAPRCGCAEPRGSRSRAICDVGGRPLRDCRCRWVLGRGATLGRDASRSGAWEPRALEATPVPYGHGETLGALAKRCRRPSHRTRPARSKIMPPSSVSGVSVWSIWRGTGPTPMISQRPLGFVPSTTPASAAMTTWVAALTPTPCPPRWPKRWRDRK